MKMPKDIDLITENSRTLLDEILEAQDSETVQNELSAQELKLLFKCKDKAFDLVQLLIQLKAKIQLRQKLKPSRPSSKK